MEHLEFLHEEFTFMIQKGLWVILLASTVQDLPGLCVSQESAVPDGYVTIHIHR